MIPSASLAIRRDDVHAEIDVRGFGGGWHLCASGWLRLGAPPPPPPPPTARYHDQVRRRRRRGVGVATARTAARGSIASERYANATSMSAAIYSARALA